MRPNRAREAHRSSCAMSCRTASMCRSSALPTKDGRIIINAVIWVERPGQKAIVIGQGGERLKEIGRLARIELNDLWQRSVHLELWVKVKENWADSEMALRQFGYDPL